MSVPNLCGSCRLCCKSTIVRVSQEDIEKWQKDGKYKILLSLENWTGNFITLMHKWDKDECVFLTDEGCSIYDDRPAVCRKFPSSEQQVKDFGCLLDWKTHTPK